MPLSKISDWEKFLAIDNSHASVHDDAFSIQKTCDGTILRMAVADLAITMPAEELRQSVARFIQNPYKRNVRTGAVSPRIAFPRNIQMRYGLKHGREQPVSILHAIISNDGRVQDIEHSLENLKVEIVNFTDKELSTANRRIKGVYEEMRSLVVELLKGNQQGKTWHVPPGPSKTIEFLLRVMSKGAATLAKRESIPVLHKNHKKQHDYEFSRTFTGNPVVGNCQDGFVQCNAPLRRTTDLVNAVNIVTARNGAFFRADLLDRMEKALKECPADNQQPFDSREED